jgi:hypothetical protein
MEISYAEGTAIQLQDAARDLNTRIKTLEQAQPLIPTDNEALTLRVKALEDEIVLLRAALEPKS